VKANVVVGASELALGRGDELGEGSEHRNVALALERRVEIAGAHELGLASSPGPGPRAAAVQFSARGVEAVRGCGVAWATEQSPAAPRLR
jgi:hypothetical protein